MAIQHRRGLKVDFDPNKMLPGEFAYALDTAELFYCYGVGNVKRLATIEDLQILLDTNETAYTALQQLIAELENETVLTGILSDISNLQDNKLDKTGVSNNNTVIFSEASEDEDIVSGETHTILFGKILKSIKTFRDDLATHQAESMIHRRIFAGYDEPLNTQEGDIWLDLNPPRKILADWRMLETSGENVIDYSGNGYHGTIIGNVERVSPINEGSLSALKGDGETGYIQTPFNAIAGLDNFEVVAYVTINGLRPNAISDATGWNGIVNQFRTSGSPSEYKNIGYHVSYQEWVDSNKPNERQGLGFSARIFTIDGETIRYTDNSLYSNIYAEFGVPYKLTLDFDGKIGIATFKVEKVLSNGQLEHVGYRSSLISGIMQFGTNPLNLMASNTDKVKEHGNITLGRVTISTKMR